MEWLTVFTLIGIYFLAYLPSFYLPALVHVALLHLYFLVPLPKSTWFRSLSLWDYARKTLYKTTFTYESGKELGDILAVYPHGDFAEAGILTLILNKKFVEYDPVTLKLLLYVPIAKDFSAICGAEEASKENLRYMLDKNRKVMIFPAGLSEILGDGLVKRTGIFKLACKAKKVITPVWIENGDSMYWKTDKFIGLQRKMKRWCGYPWPNLTWGIIFFPLFKKLHVYFGKPIESVKGEEGFKIMQKNYYDELERLKQKAKRKIKSE